MTLRGATRRLRRSDSTVVWAIVAIAARIGALATRRPGLVALRAESLARRGRSTDAAELYLRAAAHARGRAAWAVQAGEAYTAIDDHAAAARAFRRATELEPDRAIHHHALARASERARDHDGAIVAYERALALDDTYPAWHLRLGRLLDKRRAWSEAEPVLERAIALNGSDAELHHLLGRARAGLGRWPDAVAALSEAVELGPRADRFHELGRAQEQVLVPGVHRDAVLGLLPGERPDWAAAARSFAAAAALEPDVAVHHERAGTAHANDGDLDGAVRALRRAHELEPEDAVLAYRLGMAILQQGGRRQLEPAERSEAEAAFTHALAAKPDHAGARKRLVNARITDGDWTNASRLAWPTLDGPPYPTGVVGELGSFLDAPGRGHDLGPLARDLAATRGAELTDVPSDWFRVLHCRLLSLGRFSLAYRVKALMAERTVAATGDPPRPGPALDVIRALAYLGRDDDAAEALAEAVRSAPDARWRAVFEKVGGDLELQRGRPAEAAPQLASAHETVGTGAEERFRAMVAGKRVAVVGPAVPQGDNGAAIDGFDVVVRTRHLAGTTAPDTARVGSRTDIAYYASTGAGLFGDQIRHALREGDLDLAVFRTSTYTPHLPYLERPGDLRYVPSEFKAGFLGGPMAILRIVYDLLRYDPAGITVFNIDFFLSPDEYGPGHDVEKRTEEQWRELGVLAARALAHDYLSDFAMTRTLHEAGLLDADPAVAALLRMTPDEYLAAMDRNRAIT